MPYETRWYDDNHIYLIELFGEVTIHSLVNLSEIYADMIETHGQDRTIHTIVDTTRMTRFPTDVIHIRQIAHPHISTHAGWTIVITNKPLVKFTATAVTQLLPVRFRVMISFEAAVEFLNTYETKHASNAANR